MFEFSKNIEPYVQVELDLAKQARCQNESAKEFHYLENAHILGQESTYHHTRVHILMLFWGIRQRSFREVLGQLPRIVGAFTKTAIGLIPFGNTGGSNVHPFKSLPLSAKHAQIITAAKSNA